MMDKSLEVILKGIQEYADQHFHFSFDPQNPIVKLHEPSYGAEEVFAATKTMLSTYVTMGKQVKEFEQQLSHYFQTQYATYVNSGASANLLAISALQNPKIQNRLFPGDEVLVPALSWSTTIWPLIQNQLIPVFVDCDPKTFNMDLQMVEQALSNSNHKIKAIMPIHTYGNPCDMQHLMDIAHHYNLQVIEDTCESMGTKYKDQYTGTFGRVGTFSLYFSHHITTFEGGICITDDFDLVEVMRVMRAHGWSRESESHDKYAKANPEIDPRFIFVNLGYNLRPTEIQAAVGKLQLPKLDKINEHRRMVFDYYKKHLSCYGSIFSFQESTKNSTPGWFGFSFILKDQNKVSLKAITQHLNQKGIETRPVIAGNIVRHPAIQDYQYRVVGTLENSTHIMNHGFAIGCHHAISKESMEYVINVLKAYLN